MSIYDEKPWLKFFDEGIDPEVLVPDASYVDLFLETAEKFPDQPAIHFMGVTLSYRGLNDLSARFSAYLQTCGCQAGDTVGINLPNIPQYLIALVGALRRGCAVTGISPLLTPSEMAYQINDSNTKFLVTLDAIFEHRLREVAEDVPHLKHVAAANIGDYLPVVKRTLGKLLKKIPTGKVASLPGMQAIPCRVAEYDGG